MADFLQTQNIFSCGEVAPDFYAINNIHGVSELKNMDILLSGGLKRRNGLKKISAIPDVSVLVPFVISDTEKYLLVIYQQSMDIYQNDTKIQTIIAPWSDNDLSKLQYVQQFNTIFFVHPNYRPQILVKQRNNFSISPFSFTVDSDANVNIPFMRFEDTENISISITTSGMGNNRATFTASADLWSDDWIGTRLLVADKQWVIESVSSARVAIAYTNQEIPLPQTPITQWWESAFGAHRGWPMTVAFHQNRLVFGGTPSAPNNIWMSKTGDYHNFDVGTGLDDDAIFTALLSSQHNQISNIVSTDTLQILTSIGEWAISNAPLTPSNIDIKQHTSVGSIITRYLPPQKIEGATVFISRSGKDIRELDMDTLSQNYNANDLCLYAKHLMNDPISIAYNQIIHRLFVVMNDGYMAVLNKYSNTDISGWARYETDGQFKYVAVMDDTTYVIVSRNNISYLEKFDSESLIDANSYAFSYSVSGLPMIVNGHGPKKIRARKISVRLRDTKSVFINGHRVQIPNDVYDAASNGFDGDLSLNLLGYNFDAMAPLWTISSDESLPTTILSVTTDGWYSI